MARGWAEDVSATDLAYMAGIVDGEGCISCSCYSQGRRVINCRVLITNTSEAMISWISQKFGAPMRSELRRNDNWQHIYVVSFSNKQSKQLLEAIKPYLVSKVRQADILLEIMSTAVHTGKGVPDSVQEQREELVKELQHLNGRGSVKKLFNGG